MAEIKEVRIRVSLGATLQVDGVNWAKPAFTEEIAFDDLPDDKQLEEAYEWLMDQVEWGGDQMAQILRDKLKEFPQGDPIQAHSRPAVQRAVVKDAPPLAKGSKYE
jgi:hypothetical protein